MPYLGKQPSRTAFDASDIPDNSITAAKILDGVITAEDIGAGEVDTAELAADAVDGTKIADNAIDSEHIAAGAVDNAHLATGIASSKLTGALPALDGSSLTGTGSPSITDNGNATAMTIDSTEQISIGAASGGARLLVAATGNETGFQVESSVAAETTAVLKGGGTGAVSVLECRDSSNSAVLKVYQDGRGLSQFTAKAWASWNLNGTASIHDSHNVSSLVDNGTGDSTINFDNDMANANYSVTGMSDDAFRLLSLRDQSYTNVAWTRFASTITSNTTWDDANRLMATWFGD